MCEEAGKKLLKSIKKCHQSLEKEVNMVQEQGDGKSVWYLYPVGTSNRHHKIVLAKPLRDLIIETQDETQI